MKLALLLSFPLVACAAPCPARQASEVALERPVASTVDAATPAPVETAAVATRIVDAGSTDAELVAEFARSVTTVDATHVKVPRAMVDRILENQKVLMGAARLVPEQSNGKTVGIRLFGVRPDTLLSPLGFRNGDRVDRVNGFSMVDPDQAIEAFSAARTAKQVKIDIVREKKPITLVIDVI